MQVKLRDATGLTGAVPQARCDNEAGGKVGKVLVSADHKSQQVTIRSNAV